MATSLERSENGARSVIYDQISTIRWNISKKNRSGGSCDNLSERLVLKKETSSCTPLPVLNSGVAGPKFTKFTNSVARSSQITFLKIKMTIFQAVRNAKATNENESANISHFLVAMVTSLERSKKQDQIGNLRSNTYHTVLIWWKLVQQILRSTCLKNY